jgi:hypothetical protein
VVRKTQRVAFGRINRRGATLDLRPFAEDMQALAASHRTEAVVAGKRWIASDMELRVRGRFMVGLLGFATSGAVRSFEEEEFSWLKGTTTYFEGAEPDTVVPFAVDLGESSRWVAVATSARIRHNAFSVGLEGVLNEAVTAIGLLAADWDVDMISEPSDLLHWISNHAGSIRSFRRVVRFSNPGRDFDAARQDMRALQARSLEEVYRGTAERPLQLQNNEAFERMIDGLDRGDVDVELVAETATSRTRYNTKNKPAETFVDPFDGFDAGMDRVLDALVEYSARQPPRV